MFNNLTIYSQVRHKHSFLSPVVPCRGITDGFLTEHVLHKTERTCRTEQKVSYKNTHQTERNLCYKVQTHVSHRTHVSHTTHVSHRTHMKHRGFRLLLFCFDCIVLQMINIYRCLHL